MLKIPSTSSPGAVVVAVPLFGEVLRAVALRVTSSALLVASPAYSEDREAERGRPRQGDGDGVGAAGDVFRVEQRDGVVAVDAALHRRC